MIQVINVWCQSVILGRAPAVSRHLEQGNKSLWQHLNVSVFVRMNRQLWNTSAGCISVKSQSFIQSFMIKISNGLQLPARFDFQGVVKNWTACIRSRHNGRRPLVLIIYSHYRDLQNNWNNTPTGSDSKLVPTAVENRWNVSIILQVAVDRVVY
jgi:hypothetical protein